jgi:hypothetical protein
MKVKRYYRSLLVGLLFLSTVMVSCKSSSQDSVPISSDEKQPITTQDQLMNMESRISELEKEVIALHEDDARLSQALEESNKSIADLANFNTNYTSKDIKALYYLTWYGASMGKMPPDVYNYVTGRYGGPLFDDSVGVHRLVIELPGGRALKLNLSPGL